MDGQYFVCGQIKYFFSTLMVNPNKKLKCKAYHYPNNNKMNRFIRTLNYLLLDGDKYWKVINNYLLYILHHSKWNLVKLAQRLQVDVSVLTKYVLNPNLTQYERIAKSLGREKLFNHIYSSPLDDEIKLFLFSLATRQTSKLTQQNIKDLIAYLKEGYHFNPNQPLAEEAFRKIISHKTFVKDTYWNNIDKRYFQNNDMFISN
ncbi:hypothetical protein [Fictibacillus sp. UD]|uniref:hypothetical protein n=1 Tax=Fictibacillus sp. UD TaxID=3038777 RepID=UPI003748C991